MAVRTDPQAATAKWVSRLSGATQEIQAGVQRVNIAPGQQAAAKYQKWLNGVQAAAEKWRRNVARVSLADWQNAMIQIGVPRVAQGAQQKQGKYQAFAAEFLPHLEQGVAQIDRMPDDTFENRVQRAVAMMRHNAQFKRSGSVSTHG